MLELSEAELAAIGLLLTAPDDAALLTPENKALVKDLEQAGILVDGELQGFAARILAVFGEPQLRVVVERFPVAEPETQRELAAVRDELAVWAETTRDGTIEYTPVEPALVPSRVARAVGLGPRTEQGWSGTLQLSGAALQLALDGLAGQDVAGADSDLERMTSLDETERKVLCCPGRPRRPLSQAGS